MRFYSLFFYFFLCFSHQSAALNQEYPLQSLSRCGSAIAAKALSGKEIVLRTGEHVMLAAIKAPLVQSSLRQILDGRAGIGGQAKMLLNRLIAGKRVKLYCEGTRRDYRNRLVAHVVIEGAIAPVSHDLLVKGLVWFYPEKRQRKLNAILQAAENQARQNKQGLWSAENSLMILANKPPDNLIKHKNYYAEGKVINAEKRGNWVYLNFGKRYSRDFTFRLSETVAKNLLVSAGHNQSPEASPSYSSLKGQTVAGRGMLIFRGGPMITIIVPDRIALQKQD